MKVCPSSAQTRRCCAEARGHSRWQAGWHCEGEETHRVEERSSTCDGPLLTEIDGEAKVSELEAHVLGEQDVLGLWGVRGRGKKGSGRARSRAVSVKHCIDD